MTHDLTPIYQIVEVAIRLTTIAKPQPEFTDVNTPNAELQGKTQNKLAGRCKASCFQTLTKI